MKAVLPIEFDFSDGLKIEPDAGKRALETAQAGPTAPVVGPYIYNLLSINNAVKATGADPRTMGVLLQFNCGGEDGTGGVYGHFVNLRHTTASNSGDHQALTGIARSEAPNTGPGELFGINAAAYADDGCVSAGVNGAEFDVAVDDGATVQHRIGVSVINDGNSVAAQQDAAYWIMSTTAGGGFKTGILLSKLWNHAPLQAAGDVLGVDGAQTVCNVLNLTDLTVSGHIIKHPKFNAKGDGSLNIAGPVVINSTAPEFLLYDSDGPVDGKYFSFYAQGGVFKIDNISDAGVRSNRMTLPVTKPTVTGSRALASPITLSMLAALATLGLITDGTTP